MSAGSAWSERVREQFRLAHGAGGLAPAPGVGRGCAGAVSWGTSVRVDVRLGPDGRLAGFGWQCFGCPAAQAACSLLAATAVGLTAGESQALSPSWMAMELELPPERMGALVLVEDAFRRALADAGGVQ